MTEMPTAQTMWDPSPVSAILAFLVMAWKETVQVHVYIQSKDGNS